MTEIRRPKQYISTNGIELIVTTRRNSRALLDSKHNEQPLDPRLVQIIHLLAEAAAEEDLKNKDF